MPVHFEKGDYYTLAEAAARLGYVDGSALRHACIKGNIFAVKIAKTWLIPESTLRILEEKEVKPQGNRGVTRK